MTSLLCLAISGVVWPGVRNAYGFPEYRELFREKYGERRKLDSCVTCHAWMDNATLNPYGKGFLAGGADEKALGKMENADSDGDGFKDLLEIMAYRFPGDAGDRPTAEEKNACDSGHAVEADPEGELMATMRCPCGCDKTIGQCRCPLSAKIRGKIREEVRKKGSAEAAKRAVAARYGEKSLPLDEQNDVLPSAMFRQERVRRAYRIAAAIPEALQAVPCYCFCYGKSSRHESLLDCFKSRHGSQCAICIDEAIMVSEMRAEGKTTAEIQAAVKLKLHKR